MNSHQREALDWGADLGIIDGNKSVLLLIARNKVGFAATNATSFINGSFYEIDTTDGFHLYRIINLYI